MVNLDFSDGTSPPSDILLGRRKSPRKHPSNPSPPPPPEPAAAEQVTKKKKKNKKKTLGSSSRIWYEDDELTVLKGLVDYQAEKGNEPNSNWADFYRFLGDSFTARFSKDQVLTKIRKLKAKFLASMQRGNTTKSEAFRLSKKIWGGPNESDQSDIHNKSGEEEMANDEPSNDEVTKAEFESNDESWAVRDAFETMVSRGLSDYQKKLQLEKLMNLGSGKRKELSDEWKELCAEEVKLNIKRFKFSAMLAEAAAKWELWNMKRRGDSDTILIEISFMAYTKDLINIPFSRKQLMEQVKKLKMRFEFYLERSKDGIQLSFTNSYEKELFRLATIIWAKNETEDAFSENRLDQAKDVPLVEQKRVNDTRMDKDKSEEQGGTDEFYVLRDALEAATSFSEFRENSTENVVSEFENFWSSAKERASW